MGTWAAEKLSTPCSSRQRLVAATGNCDLAPGKLVLGTIELQPSWQRLWQLYTPIGLMPRGYGAATKQVAAYGGLATPPLNLCSQVCSAPQLCEQSPSHAQHLH
jgi:hypothetical protein